jgi:hypothetical protein
MKKFIVCYQPKNHKKFYEYKPIWAKDKIKAMKKAEDNCKKGYWLSWLLPSKIFNKMYADPNGYSCFSNSAKVLDSKRLGKQRVEGMQILKTLVTGPIQNSLVPKKGFKYKDGLYQRKTPWYNHPAVRMWDGYHWILYDYVIDMCLEWKARGYKDTIYNKLGSIMIPFDSVETADDYIKKSTTLPPWMGDESFYLAHRSNLLRKFPGHYRPLWPSDPDNLPYIWPVQKKGV